MRSLWLGTALLLSTSIVHAQDEASEDAPTDQAAVQAAEEAPPTEDPEDESDTGEPELSPEDQEARNHFVLGQSLYEEGRFEESAAEFQLAYDASGRPELLYNLYLARRDSGEIVAAEAALEKYLLEVPYAPNRTMLTQRLGALRDQIARSNSQQEAVERAEAEALAASARVEPNRLGPVLVFTAGGASLIAAGALALSVRGVSSDLENGCIDTFCPPAFHDAIDQQRRRALSVDVLLGLGVGLFVAGGLYWALQPDRAPATQVACGGLGCSVRGAF